MMLPESIDINHIINAALSLLSSALGVVYGNGVVRRTYTIYRAKSVENLAALICGIVVYYSLSEYMGIAFLISFIVASHINKFIGVGGAKLILESFMNKLK